MEEIKVGVTTGLLTRSTQRYMKEIENIVDNWSPIPSRNDEENPIEELYVYKKDVEEIIRLIYGKREDHDFEFSEFILLDKIQSLIEQHEPEEIIPDSWERA